MAISVSGNKVSAQFTPKRIALPSTQARRRRYWEGTPQTRFPRPDIEALAGVRFLIDRIYCDETINYSSSIHESFSGEELVGILLKIRDALISNEYDDLIAEDDREALEWSIKNRTIELKNEGFEPEQIKEIIKLEYPDHIRLDILKRQKNERVLSR